MYTNMIRHYMKLAKPDNPSEYIRKATKDYIRNNIDQKILNCKECKICNDDHRSITRGDTNSDLMVIGSNPHRLEGKSRYPFSLSSVDEKFVTIFDFYNINMDYVFYMNVVNCLPTMGGKDRMPSSEEVARCSIYTKQMIDAIRPSVIVLLGPAPYNALKDSEFFNSFNNILGKWTSVMGIPAIVTHNIYDLEDEDKWGHPEDLIEAKEEFVSHFVKAFDKVKEVNPNSYLLDREVG